MYTFREAGLSDIAGMKEIRMLVRENVLSNPALVTDKDYENHLNLFGKGWVCEIDNRIVGFSFVNLDTKNIWALFIHPDFQVQGIGKELHRLMINWYFSQTKELVWLGTAPHSRAEKFYRLQGWKENGMHGDKEIKFEMSFEDWKNKTKNE